MIGPLRKKSSAGLHACRRFSLAVAIAALAALAAACGTDYYEIPIETPIQPKLDVSAFQRVLVIGFVAGGTEDVDANQETVRLLRSQLRTKSGLRVIDADVLPLIEIAREQNRELSQPLVIGFVAGGTEDVDANQETVRLLRSQLRTKSALRVIDADVLPLIEIAREQNRELSQPLIIEDASAPREGNAGPSRTSNGGGAQGVALPQNIRDEKDLEPYERLFANTAYWKRIGEEFQNPLIVTGTVLFTNRSTSGFVQRDQETFDSLGRRRVIPMRTYMERKGFILRPKFVFIDGRTGAQMYSESYREEILYNAQQNTPALSSYFELMDRLVPNFLSALSSQKIRGTRVLLK